jgi:hypothetical protein
MESDSIKINYPIDSALEIIPFEHCQGITMILSIKENEEDFHTNWLLLKNESNPPKFIIDPEKVTSNSV